MVKGNVTPSPRRWALTSGQSCPAVRRHKLSASLTVAVVVMLLADACLAPHAWTKRVVSAPAGESLPPVLGGRPIWARGETDPGVVALFRRTFDLPAGLADPQLSIIADTRYEVWLDGRWLGRGPARFSRVRQEFDYLPLEDLSPGTHLMAVVVQFAPNQRRSESVRPALQASVQGWTETGWQEVAASGSEWKAIISPAWDGNAAPVSELQLIGPMEILDLRQLPAGWLQPRFDDSAWPLAEEIEPTPFPALTPRTIPQLRQVTRLPAGLVESGLLSPGWQLVELEAPGGTASITYCLPVTATRPTLLRVEALDAGPVAVDGSPPLTWQERLDARRPDVLVASAWLAAGAHRLEIQVPGDGSTFGQGPEAEAIDTDDAAGHSNSNALGGRVLVIEQENLQVAAAPGNAASHHPGKRSLLANPVPGSDEAPQVSLEEGGAEVYLPAGSAARYLVLDFGRTLHGRVVMEAEGPAGTVIDAGWDERLTEGRPLPNPGSLVSNLWSQVDSWTLDGTRRSLTTLDARAGRYLLIQVWGPGPVRLRRVHVQEELYPVEQVGTFASSDPLLDTIWQVGVDTLRPNMTDAYTDTPWRERGQWWGDAMISYYANRAVFGDLALLLRGLRQMADAIDQDGRPPGMAPNWPGGFMLDFGMLWIEGLYLYWTQSQDLGPVAELYPAAERLASWLESYQDPSGLMDVPPAHWSESALVDWSALDSRSGESTALNAQYSAALWQLGELAQALGDGVRAQYYSDMSTAIRERMNDLLYLPAEGCYATSRLDGTVVAPSVHAQAWALRYDVVPPEARASTVAALTRQLEPFFGAEGFSATESMGMFYVLEGLAEGGATTAALALIRERYGAMLAQGATTWWELYTPRQTRGNSLSHSWGASPTWFLSSHVLGSTVLDPTRWRVAPHPGDLRFAQGSVPMGSGTLDVAWQVPGCGELRLTVVSPQGTRGEVLLPVYRFDAQVIMDGTILWDGGPLTQHAMEMSGDGLLISGISDGPHEILVSSTCYATWLPLAPSASETGFE
jgi:alpha-L-rhamnosidase